MTSLLSVSGLTTTYPTPAGEFRAVDQVSFEVQPSERVAIVGESGSGKSQTVLSVLGLVQKPGRVSGTARFRGRDLLQLSRHELRRVRGGEIAMIFQDPMTSWNPVLRVGTQIEEAILLHRNVGSTERARQVRHLLEQVGIADPAERARNYPHQLSGGMRQRGMIAMGLANDPALLIADEPTTALDVTVQDQIIRLLRQLSERAGTAILLITHNLALVASLCDRVIVMYGGRILETGPTDRIFSAPQHPYTQGLLKSIPRLDHAKAERLDAIQGQPLAADTPVRGCKFHPRCPHRMDRCTEEEPTLEPIADGHLARCWLTPRKSEPQAAS
jgi:peptide/nickel transport system ATP-binding protein/oligopeptide transport system ATP-binding protein